MAIDPLVRERIDRQVAEVEATEGVRVLYAVESGSRAWGFPSADSDYDVRFVYVHPRDWYLTVHERRDVIERPLTDEIDLSGWNVRKALGLFAKSNPPLLEWLDSPIVYADRDGFAERLRGLLPEFFSPLSAIHHYLSMARRTFREQLNGERVRVKKYFYALRPLLAAAWIAAGRGPVPMLFPTLLEASRGDDAFRISVTELMERKRSGAEIADGPPVPELHAFIASELARLQAVADDQPRSRGDMRKLDALFRDCLT